ncbi:MAG: hypothetical protein ACRD82_14975, partial [Blastocatellia bacterium]
VREGVGVLGRYDGEANDNSSGVFGYTTGGFAGVRGAGTRIGVYGQTGNGDESGVHGRNDGKNPQAGWECSV